MSIHHKVLLLCNGKVYSSLGIYDSMVISDGKVQFLGSEEECREIAGKEVVVVDLRGYTVLPGFIDAHMHLSEYATSRQQLDLRNVHSIRELRSRLGLFASSKKEGEWIVGRGWDQELFEEHRWPTKEDIDDIVPRNPTLLFRVCGHAALANSKALEIAGIDAKTPNPPGGVIERKPDGTLTGILKESAIELVRRHIPKPTFNELLCSIRDALFELARYGVTCICTMSCDEQLLKVLWTLYEMNSLPIRVRIFLPSALIERAARLKDKVKNPYLKILGIKLFADGSLGARTAFLREPYADADTRGSLCTDPQALRENLHKAEALGLQVAIHAIGDGALEKVIEIYEREGTPFMRHRIEHASITPPDLVKRMRSLGVVAVVQPHFIISDWWVVERVGPSRAPWVYAFRTLLLADVPLAFSTDAPVEPVNPWLTVYAAVTRGKNEGISLYEYTKKERLPIGAAIDCYTRGSAYAIFEEGHLGEIRIGSFADLIVVEQDPFTMDPKELKELKVLLTMVGGKVVFHDPSAFKLPPQVILSPP